MICRLSIFVPVVSGLLVLAACETPPEPGMEPEGMDAVNAEFLVHPWQGVRDTRLVVQGAPANDVLNRRGASGLNSALERFGGTERSGKLFDRVSQIRDSNEISSIDVPGLTGVGGIFGHAFVEAAARKHIRNINRGAGVWGRFDPLSSVEMNLAGQIVDYHHNDGDGSGRIESITYIEYAYTPPGGGAPVEWTDAYRYKVVIDPGGFEVVPRCDVNPPQCTPGDTDPFPGTIGFDSQTLQRIWDPTDGFRYKLWANGTEIRVTEVKRVANYTGGVDWSTVPALPNAGPYARLYETDADSCVDMMFQNEPPETLPDDAAPPFYCLGRCADPLLINTR